MLIIYLHGYGSSPNTVKGEKIKNFFINTYPDFNFIAPHIDYMKDGLYVIESIISQYPNEKKIIVGSSFGGLVARFLTESNIEVVASILINPALDIYKVLEKSNEDLSIENLDIISKLVYKTTLDMNSYLLLCQRDDEICDWVSNRIILPNCNFYLGNGSGHGFENIEVTFGLCKEFIDRKLGIKYNSTHRWS
jgi:predicted esterase YcpF (UPF0227 family)